VRGGEQRRHPAAANSASAPAASPVAASAAAWKPCASGGAVVILAERAAAPLDRALGHGQRQVRLAAAQRGDRDDDVSVGHAAQHWGLLDQRRAHRLVLGQRVGPAALGDQRGGELDARAGDHLRVRLVAELQSMSSAARNSFSASAKRPSSAITVPSDATRMAVSGA